MALAPHILKAVSVTVPSITDPDIAKVDVTIATALLGWTITSGDAVLICPEEALPTNCRLQNAYVSADNTVTVVYGSEGGNVTGAAKTHTFVFHDLT